MRCNSVIRDKKKDLIGITNVSWWKSHVWKRSVSPESPPTRPLNTCTELEFSGSRPCNVCCSWNGVGCLHALVGSWKNVPEWQDWTVGWSSWMCCRLQKETLRITCLSLTLMLMAAADGRECHSGVFTRNLLYLGSPLVMLLDFLPR